MKNEPPHLVRLHIENGFRNDALRRIAIVLCAISFLALLFLRLREKPKTETATLPETQAVTQAPTIPEEIPVVAAETNLQSPMETNSVAATAQQSLEDASAETPATTSIDSEVPPGYKRIKFAVSGGFGKPQTQTK
jgi:hypothetical protein